jgi:hypothetical protein
MFDFLLKKFFCGYLVFLYPKTSLFYPLLSTETFSILGVSFPAMSIIPFFNVLTDLRHFLVPSQLNSATRLAVLRSSIPITWPHNLNYSPTISVLLDLLANANFLNGYGAAPPNHPPIWGTMIFFQG